MYVSVFRVLFCYKSFLKRSGLKRTQKCISYTISCIKNVYYKILKLIAVGVDATMDIVALRILVLILLQWMPLYYDVCCENKAFFIFSSLYHFYTINVSSMFLVLE